MRVVVKPEYLQQRQDLTFSFVTRGWVLVKVDIGDRNHEGNGRTYKRIGYFGLEKDKSNVSGIQYPDATNNPSEVSI